MAHGVGCLGCRVVGLVGLLRTNSLGVYTGQFIRSNSARCLVDIGAGPICQDGVRDDVNEMIRPWRE